MRKRLHVSRLLLYSFLSLSMGTSHEKILMIIYTPLSCDAYFDAYMKHHAARSRRALADEPARARPPFHTYFSQCLRPPPCCSSSPPATSYRRINYNASISGKHVFPPYLASAAAYRLRSPKHIDEWQINTSMNAILSLDAWMEAVYVLNSARRAFPDHPIMSPFVIAIRTHVICPVISIIYYARRLIIIYCYAAQQISGFYLFLLCLLYARRALRWPRAAAFTQQRVYSAAPCVGHTRYMMHFATSTRIFYPFSLYRHVAQNARLPFPSFSAICNEA